MQGLALLLMLIVCNSNSATRKFLTTEHDGGRGKHASLWHTNLRITHRIWLADRQGRQEGRTVVAVGIHLQAQWAVVHCILLGKRGCLLDGKHVHAIDPHPCAQSDRLHTVQFVSMQLIGDNVHSTKQGMYAAQIPGT